MCVCVCVIFCISLVQCVNVYDDLSGYGYRCCNSHLLCRVRQTHTGVSMMKRAKICLPGGVPADRVSNIQPIEELYSFPVLCFSKWIYRLRVLDFSVFINIDSLYHSFIVSRMKLIKVECPFQMHRLSFIYHLLMTVYMTLQCVIVRSYIISCNLMKICVTLNK